jgi:large subunit ribosomal protein L19
MGCAPGFDAASFSNIQGLVYYMNRNLNLSYPFHQLVKRLMRTRAIESETAFSRFKVENAKVVDPSQRRDRLLCINNAFADQVGLRSAAWPPSSPGTESSVRITKPYCKKLLKEIELGEIDRMKKLRSFVMPRVGLGDYIQVRYELSRTQQTFSIFEGYCIKIAKKGLNASFTLKNTYDGVGVEQLFPFYSPRLLDVRVVKAVSKSVLSRSSRRKVLTNRNYRYRWQNYVRHLYSEGFRVRWRQIRQHPGVMSLEPRIKRELARLRRQYSMMRHEAGLPAYVWPGPYSVHMRQSKEVNAERMRRMLVYAWDAKRKDKAKIDAKRPRWRRRILEKPGSILDELPRDHILHTGNLPK